MGSNNEYICIILSYCSSNFYSSNIIKIIKGFKINLKSSLIHVHIIYIQGKKTYVIKYSCLWNLPKELVEINLQIW